MSHWRDVKEFKPYMWIHGIYAIVYTRLPDGNIMVDDNRLNTCNKSEGVTFMYGGDALLELQDAVAMREVLELLKVAFEVGRPLATKEQADIYTQWIARIDSVLNGKKITW